MNYWCRMNLMEYSVKGVKQGAFIHNGDNIPMSPRFEYVKDLWIWINGPDCPFEWNEYDPDGTFIGGRMKMKNI